MTAPNSPEGSLQEDLGASSADADDRATVAPHGAADASPPSGTVSTGAGDNLTSEEEFERVMDATQTLIQLKPGEPLTEQEIADLRLLDEFNRRDQERAIDAFNRGYECGLARGAGADVAKLIDERDSARNETSITNALSSARERHAFLAGAQAMREMTARFVEQGHSFDVADSIRLNWNLEWGGDPGRPSEERYATARPVEISAKVGSSARDSNSDRNGEDVRSTAEGEASQSGDGAAGASPKLPESPHP